MRYTLIYMLIVALGGSFVGVGVLSVFKAFNEQKATERSASSEKLKKLTLSYTDYYRLSMADIGNGVKETELNGEDFDIYKTDFMPCQVILTCSADNLDTKILRILCGDNHNNTGRRTPFVIPGIGLNYIDHYERILINQILLNNTQPHYNAIFYVAPFPGNPSLPPNVLS